MSNGVDRLSIEAIEDQPRHRPAPPPVPPPQPQMEQRYVPLDTQAQRQQRAAAIRAHVLAVLQAVALIVSARLLLLLSVSAAFVLAYLATQAQSILSVGVLIAWNVLTVIPLIWLDHIGRAPPNPYQGAR